MTHTETWSEEDHHADLTEFERLQDVNADLLAVLERLLQRYVDRTLWMIDPFAPVEKESVIIAARAAIAKAKGE